MTGLCGGAVTGLCGGPAKNWGLAGRAVLGLAGRAVLGRRCIINGVFWCMGMDEEIKADMNVDFVGPYQPTPFSFNGEAQNVKPADLAGWESPIMPKGEKHAPKRTVKRN